MRKFFTLLFACTAFYFSSSAQATQLDITDFATKITVPFVMPDGVKLGTDIYLPRMRKPLQFSLGDIDLGFTTLHTEQITFVPKGAQIIFYDSINGQPNPNPYQLPSIFTRTPYDKGDFDQLGAILPLMGYNYFYQDMRGAYSSEGVYFPMYSDSWNKNPYHPGKGHVLDYLDPADPKFSNKHEDGYNSVKIIQTIDSAYIAALVGDSVASMLYAGLPHANTKVNNGSIGMFGASALGNTQLQLGLAHRITDSLKNLKCLMPIVATTEHYISTGYNNGTFRDRIVTGWLKGQIFSIIDDDLMPGDNQRQNSIHSSRDYDLPKTISTNNVSREYQQNKFEAANLAIDHFTEFRYTKPDGSLANAGFYPNSIGRPDMDGSQAMVNAIGEAVDPVTQQPLPNRTYSRYTNLDVPVFHVTGWWDIFTEGQINTMNYTMQQINSINKFKQKMAIGPWAHQTIASRISGDRFYPKNVTEVTRIDLTNFSLDEVPLSMVLSSDLITWFRYNLNYNDDYKVNEPKFIIKESQEWQVLGVLFPGTVNDTVFVRVPAEDYVVLFVDMINFLSGAGNLDGLKLEVKSNTLGTFTTTQNVPSSGPLLPVAGDPLTGIPYRDFMNDVPAFRAYVAGPDSAADASAGYPGNSRIGNWWFNSEVFPPSEHIEWKKMFLHQDGSFNMTAPVQDEGYKLYVSDPDDPILTVGGSNMIVRSPDGTRNSQSQMELSDPTNAPYTMDREGVIQFNSETLADSFTIVGLPVCTLYAKSNPGGVADGPTDTDWDMRICDVWPDGRVYFVQEGVVNARARDWARALVDSMGTSGTSTYANGNEDPGDKDLPYSNINIGEMYEYVFKMMPIGYCWAPGHKIRVLISSTNYTRYQANPNLPLNEGEFFRRKPGDGQSYVYDGVEMFPRVAVQRVHFSPEHPTSINFPVYNKDFIYNDIPKVNTAVLDATLFPNPSSDKIQIFVNQPGEHQVTVSDITGRQVATATFDDNVIFNVSGFGAGIYFATIIDVKHPGQKITRKFTVQ